MGIEHRMFGTVSIVEDALDRIAPDEREDGVNTVAEMMEVWSQTLISHRRDFAFISLRGITESYLFILSAFSQSISILYLLRKKNN